MRVTAVGEVKPMRERIPRNLYPFKGKLAQEVQFARWANQIFFSRDLDKHAYKKRWGQFPVVSQKKRWLQRSHALLQRHAGWGWGKIILIGETFFIVTQCHSSQNFYVHARGCQFNNYDHLWVSHLHYPPQVIFSPEMSKNRSIWHSFVHRASNWRSKTPVFMLQALIDISRLKTFPMKAIGYPGRVLHRLKRKKSYIIASGATKPSFLLTANFPLVPCVPPTG